MNILHIIPSLSKGGAEQLVQDICRKLSTLEGVNVKLVVFRSETVLNNEQGFTTEVIPSSVALSISGHDHCDIGTLQHAIEEFSPDIIHSHLYESELISRSCQYPQAKWFSHAHDFMPALRNFSLSALFSKRKLTDLFEKNHLLKRYKINGGTHFIAISKRVHAHMRSVLPKEIPVTLLPNAIDLNRFTPKVEPNWGKCLRLVNVGRLDVNKNQRFLVSVMQELRKRDLECTLDILGDGPEREQLHIFLQRSGLNDRVVLHGNQDHVERFLHHSDVYVHAAISEGFGLTLLEAMASGLPVVTLDGGGNKELIIEGKNGYLIEENDPVTFADRITYLWNDKERMKEMSAYAHAFAQQYSIETYCAQLLALYKNALACVE